MQETCSSLPVKPEMTVAMEPNHENEIVSGRNSVGDYNPKSLEGSTSISSRFTRPRHDQRENGIEFRSRNYSMLPVDYCEAIGIDMILKTAISEWVEYNRIQIYRRWARLPGALSQGSPRTDQKPPNSRLFVFGSIVGISGREIRISPIDWLLTTGAAQGFSRYRNLLRPQAPT